ncbi:hypothetical protein V1478_018838 [Vespula squamosa]|uniref:Uncharacterized protein n=1 Tax=Vespula squamosa TaxID=30214 RepID=A0ABD1ZUL9_VESSQ
MRNPWAGGGVIEYQSFKIPQCQQSSLENISYNVNKQGNENSACFRERLTLDEFEETSTWKIGYKLKLDGRKT